MRREKFETSLERTFCEAAIYCKDFLISAVEFWDTALMEAKPAARVARWCIDHAKKYHDAPGINSIKARCSAWIALEKPDDEDADAVKGFIDELAGTDPLRAWNAPHLKDELANYLTTRRLSRLAETITSAVSYGHVSDALGAVTGFRTVEKGQSTGYDPLRGKTAFTEAFQKSAREVVIDFPGDAGYFLDPALTRDSLVGVRGIEKTGKCIDGDAMVDFADGSRLPIREVVKKRVKKPIMAFNEKTQRFEAKQIERFWANGVKRCVRMTTRSGRSVITTTNHKYLTPDGWKEVGDIALGDFVAVPKRSGTNGNQPMNVNKLRFLAYMIAEGGCSANFVNGKPNGCASIFTNADPEILEEFKSTCTSLSIGYKQSKSRPYDWQLSRAKLLMRELGLYGKSAKTKRIPPMVFQLPDSQVTDFLNVVFSCDGSIYKAPSGQIIEIGLANKGLISDLGVLLIRFGIVFSVRSKLVAGKFPAWVLSINSQEYVNKFLQLINFRSVKRREEFEVKTRKSFLDILPWQIAGRFQQEIEQREPSFFQLERKGNGIRHLVKMKKNLMRQSFSEAAGSFTYDKYIYSDILWDRVEKIEDVGERDTYDLSIPDLHNFIADNCIVHNTWWCIEFLYRAIRSGRRVAFFEVGDLSKQQLDTRLAMRIAGIPLWPKQLTGVRLPTSIEREEIAGEWKTNVIYDTLTFGEVINADSANEARRKFRRRMNIARDQTQTMFSTHPSGSINVAGIDKILRQWRDELDFVPDCVLIDYADILAPEDGKTKEKRHQVDERWSALRRLSQEWHACVIIPTQADAAAYKQKSQTMGNFSESKTINAHVTGMLALNQTPEEKELQIMRLQWIPLREAPFDLRTHLYVAQCIPLGISCAKSTLGNKK